MALPVSNNNAGAPITADGTYCTIQVPGYIPPEIAAGGASPLFAAASYHIVADQNAQNTLVTFQMQGADGLFRDLSDPAPIRCANAGIYNSTLSGVFGALQIVVSGITGSKGGLTYAQLSGSTTPYPPAQNPSSLSLQSGALSTTLSLDPGSGDLLVRVLEGPNAGKSVNLTAAKWA